MIFRAIDYVRAMGARLHLFCDGPVIDEGWAMPIDKMNRPLKIIPGYWNIHRCNLCLTIYARPEDLLVPGVLPSAEFRAAAESVATRSLT